MVKKLLYTPFSIAFGILGSRVGKTAFRTLWQRISDQPKPEPRAPQSLGRVAMAAAIEGATMATAAAVARQMSARTFHFLFGVWPVRPKQPSEPGDA